MQFLLSLLAFAILWKLHDVHFAATCAFGGYAAFLAYRYWQLKTLIQTLDGIPVNGPFLLSPFASMASAFLPHIPYVNLGIRGASNNSLDYRKSTYDKWESTIWMTAGVLPPQVHVHIADPVALKHIYADRRLFPKPLHFYRVLASYGRSVLITEGDEWRKHRRVVGPAFTDSTNELDWLETTRLTRLWMADLDKRADRNGISVVEHINKSCLHLALAVICSVAFGVRINGPGEPDLPIEASEQHVYNFKSTMEGALRTLFVHILTPRIFKRLPFSKLKSARLFKREQEKWMTRIYAERKRDILSGAIPKKDVLSALVTANIAIERDASLSDAEATKVEAMTDEEVLGNMFIFLVAGHDTTAHTLAFAMALLALNPESQDWLFEELQDLMPDSQTDLPYSSFGLFTRGLAVLHETLRLFPSVPKIPKMVTTAEDVIVPCSERGPGGATHIVIPKGAFLSLDVQALSTDPANWPDPQRFLPERFVDTETYKWNRDAFYPWSSGARSCVGQKFSAVEIVCILVTLCRSYRIRLHEDDVVENESLEARTARVLAPRGGLALMPSPQLRLCFDKRQNQ